MAGPKTQRDDVRGELLQDELRRLGAPREDVHAQRFRPSPHGAPVAKTVVSGQAPPASPSPAARAHVEAVRVHHEQAARRREQDRATPENIDRASRAFRDAGLHYDDASRAMDLYLIHGTPLASAIGAVGGARMSTEDARAIERALLPRNNPNDDRAYHHALNLHAAGIPLGAAIEQARHEDAQHKARRPPQRVQFFPAPAPPAARIPPAPPRTPRRYSDIETPSQRTQNARDNRNAAIGIGVLLAALAAGVALLFGKNDTAPPAQPRQPVKPPAPPAQPPKPQPQPPVKGRALPPRR